VNGGQAVELGRPETERKFADLARGVLDEQQRSRIVELVAALSETADVRELAAALH